MSKTSRNEKSDDSDGFEKPKTPIRRIKNRRHRRITKQRVKQGCDDIPNVKESSIPNCQNEEDNYEI